MCDSFQRRYKQEEVTGAIDAYRDAGFSDEEIVERVTRRLDVGREYVLALLAQKRE